MILVVGEFCKLYECFAWWDSDSGVMEDVICNMENVFFAGWDTGCGNYELKIMN